METMPYYLSRETLGWYLSKTSDLLNYLDPLFPGLKFGKMRCRYLVGGDSNGWTAFPYIDERERIVDIRLRQYDKSGQEGKWTWHLNRMGESARRGRIGLFGEHLITKFPNLPIGIVESEKSAIIASMCIPEFLWLAVGGRGFLNHVKLAPVKNKEVFIIPDADGAELWESKSDELRHLGFQGIHFQPGIILDNANSPSDNLGEILLRGRRIRFPIKASITCHKTLIAMIETYNKTENYILCNGCKNSFYPRGSDVARKGLLGCKVIQDRKFGSNYPNNFSYPVCLQECTLFTPR